MAKIVLIVDSDPAQRRLMQAAVERLGFRARPVDDGERALEEVTSARHAVDVVLLDLVMPKLLGMETLKRMIEQRPDIPVIVMTATGGIDTAVQAMRAGAVDFFVKPASQDRIDMSIRSALSRTKRQGDQKRLCKAGDGRIRFEDMIANAPAMRSVVRLGQRAASSLIPILILGESGVGKEVVARCIESASDRAGKPFISVNCGAIPENLVESILFGHEKGSFTGATDKKLGKFVEADGGTLFLDEIGELPLDMQVKLLRVLQEGEVDAVGSRRPTKVNVRIISATNRDLAQHVKEGRFREDLYYRLNVFPIEVPSLKERREDLPALIDYFIARFNAEEGKHVQGISSKALHMLSNYDWPGNVRQLENAIFRAVVLSDGGLLTPDDFAQVTRVVKPSEDEARAQIPSEAAAPDQPVSVTDPGGGLRTLDAIERDLIQFAIEHYAGRMSEVALRLGIARSTLYRKVHEFGIRTRECYPHEDGLRGRGASINVREAPAVCGVC
jgi:DNA-binding NtrC family response regulator